MRARRVGLQALPLARLLQHGAQRQQPLGRGRAAQASRQASTVATVRARAGWALKSRAAAALHRGSTTLRRSHCSRRLTSAVQRGRVLEPVEHGVGRCVPRSRLQRGHQPGGRTGGGENPAAFIAHQHALAVQMGQHAADQGPVGGKRHGDAALLDVAQHAGGCTVGFVSASAAAQGICEGAVQRQTASHSATRSRRWHPSAAPGRG